MCHYINRLIMNILFKKEDTKLFGYDTLLFDSDTE